MRADPPVGPSEFPDEFHAGDLACHSGVARIGKLDQGNPLGQVQLVDEVGFALVLVDRASMGEEMRGRLVDSADQTAGRVLNDADWPAVGAAQASAGRQSLPGAEPPAGPAAQQAVSCHAVCELRSDRAESGQIVRS